MYKQIFILSLLATVTYAQVGGWGNCGSPGATIHEVYVTNCTQTPCQMFRGETYDIGLEATAVQRSDRLPFNVIAQWLFATIPILSGDGCESLSYGYCPAEVGNRFRFEMYVNIPAALPSITATVTATVTNDAGTQIICIQLPVQLL